MTDKLIERIKADRKAGTDGPWEISSTPWRVLAKFSNGYWWEIANAAPVFFASNNDGSLITAGGDRSANARRIARVPNMEARILADAKIIEAAAELALVLDVITDKQWASNSTVEEAVAVDEALNKYRAAVKEARQ